MHFEGCTGVVGAKVSKRILSEPQYTRFLEFSDRAIYGDGNYLLTFAVDFALTCFV
jgi:hypothetical protein